MHLRRRPILEPEIAPFRRVLEWEFWWFFDDNPHIYGHIKDRIRQLINVRVKRYGMQSIFEVIRWHMIVTTTDPTFKINDHHKAYFSRLWTLDNPDWPDFFERRQLTGPIWPSLREPPRDRKRPKKIPRP